MLSPSRSAVVIPNPGAVTIAGVECAGTLSHVTVKRNMSLDFAAALTDVRLMQTVRLLEWMLENGDADAEAVTTALNSVIEAHASIKTLHAHEAAS